MPFEKGHKKLGGRKKGISNRYSDEVREIFKNQLFDELEQLPILLSKLEPEKRLDVLLKLIPYILPKINAVGFGFDEPTKMTHPDKIFRFDMD